MIGYGKLGGKELGYASDLDIIFLYDDADERAPEIYARLAQRLNNWLSSRTSAGQLFDTDLAAAPERRVRPAGVLGRSVPALPGGKRVGVGAPGAHARALLRRRRRPSATVSKRFAQDVSCDKRAMSPSLRRAIVEMREKLHAAHPNKSGLFDVKHDRGGMIDIEFSVQYLVLALLAAASRH